MKTVILENVGLENPVIFFGDKSWHRTADKRSPHSEARWRERTGDRKPVFHQKLSDLLEKIARHPEEVTRFDENPELDVEDSAASQWVEERVAKLDAVIVRAVVRRREDKLDVGRALNEQKRILGHGKFKLHVSETLGSLISLRTAERYMKLARKEDAASKVDKLSFLKLASDDGAHAIGTATKRAREQQAEAKSQKKDTPYKLPLVSLNADDRKALDVLRNTSDWSEAEQNIVEEVRRQCIKHGVYGETHQEEDDEDNSVNASLSGSN